MAFYLQLLVDSEEEVMSSRMHSNLNRSVILRWCILFILTCCTTTFAYAQGPTENAATLEGGLAFSMQPADDEQAIRPVRTNSPRETLETFFHLRDELEETLQAYWLNKSHELAERKELIYDQFLALIDLSSVAQASRREIGIDTTAYLLDILGRIELPDLDRVPGDEALENDDSSANWRIPGTPIRIVRIDEGPQEGEFLFSSRTVTNAPRFYRGIEDQPLQSSLPIWSWKRELPQITGPMIPTAVLRHMPQGLRDVWLDTPLWKVIAVVLVSILTLFMLFLFHRLINRHKKDNRVGVLLRRALSPIAIIAAVLFLKDFIAHQINVSGSFSGVVDIMMTVLLHASAIWLFWLVIPGDFMFRWFANRRRKKLTQVPFPPVGGDTPS